MNFNDFFKEDLILLDKNYSSKEEALKDFAKVLVKQGYASNEKRVVEMALKREAESSTGIGEGIAIPHIRDEVMKTSVIFFAKVNQINWDSLDGKPVDYVFFIALNPNSSGSHVEILAALMKLFMNESFKKELKKVNSISQLIKAMNKYNEKEEENEDINTTSKWDVVAVTACPTGIAHTFMARDMLVKAGKEMGIKIKVETQGADGIKNALTPEDIKNAKGVIIACDRVVDLSKFAGHPNVLEMGTKPVIKDAQKEIQKSLNGEGHKFAGKAKSSNPSEVESELSFNKFGKRAYKSLLTGVSYMLPFVIFGGILIALAFLFDMKNAGDKDFGTLNPVSKWMKGLGGLAFGMMVPILAAYIAYAIIGRQGLLPGFIVGLIAKGDFFFKLDPNTGQVEWLAQGGANSGVFGAIGGAFLAASIIILFVKLLNLQVNTSKGKKPWFPQSLTGIKNILVIPLFGTFLVAISFWIINIPLIYLNWVFTKFLDLFQGKPYLSWLLGLILAAMMSIDLGGPINKASYVFATTSLNAAAGQGSIAMAASMAGGMSAPIGIALSCTFFKKLWTKEERNEGYVNYIMGATFISEGAIPLTLKNPKVMMPSNIIGSAVTGIIIGALQVKISAPHGGILTVALANCELAGKSGTPLSVAFGVILFIVAVLSGGIVSMFCIYFFKKAFEKKANNNSSNSTSTKESKTKFIQKSIIFKKNNKKINSNIKNINNFNSNLVLKNNLFLN